MNLWGRAKASGKEEGEEKRKKGMGKQRLDHTTMNNRGSTAVSWEYLR